MKPSDWQPATETLICGCVVTSYPATATWSAGSVRRLCAACAESRVVGFGDHTPDYDERAIKLGLY